MLPEFVAARDHPGVAVREIAEGTPQRTIFAATRRTDASRPSVQAVLAAIREAGEALGW
jgi:DNA-binding transcriptional LysR family regulator